MTEPTYYNLYRRYKQKYLKLVNQIGGNKKKIVIFRSSTATNVFSDDQSFRQLLSQFSEIASIDIYQVDNLDGLINQFSKYKPNEVVQFIIQGHGSSNTLVVGTDRIQLDTPLWDKFESFLKFELIPRLSLTSSVFLHSSNIASESKSEKSFARRVSDILGSTVVYGSNGDVHVQDVEVLPSNTTTISYQITPDKSKSGYQIKSFVSGHGFNQQSEQFSLTHSFQFSNTD